MATDSTKATDTETIAGMTDVMIVDDDVDFCLATTKILAMQGHQVVSAESVAEARSAMQEQLPKVLLLDIFLPDGSGFELLEQLGNARPPYVVIMTGHPGVKSMIRGVSGPAVSYLTKPVDAQEIVALISSLIDSNGGENRPGLHFGLLYGESTKMQSVYDRIKRVGTTDSSVFIQGESGTGKELVAAAIHKVSGRGGRFVPVNCGGLTRELIASELFGHEKGSFTGAERRHRGFFERAAGGTLFLDEITEMPLEMQTHLLRALETGRITRVGGESEVDVDVRVLTATNRNPLEAIGENRLREDLYFRLKVFPIELPPLRERGDDVELLARRFLGELNVRYGTRKSLSSAAVEKLLGYDWPGNVRELKHTIHRCFIMADGPDASVEVPEHFEDPYGERKLGIRAGRSIRDIERELIMTTLQHFDGDKKTTAETLGVSIKTLYNRLNEYRDGSH